MNCKRPEKVLGDVLNEVDLQTQRHDALLAMRRESLIAKVGGSRRISIQKLANFGKPRKI